LYSSYKTHASLDAFCKKFSSRITNERYLIYTKEYAHEGEVKYLPAYLTVFFYSHNPLADTEELKTINKQINALQEA